ncbi:MAG: hypothetical protein JWM78_928 [Verrucomicrobiaceae bacterium]|nr:hypothetical protein [Verrucomicrobiaceae bacterium]
MVEKLMQLAIASPGIVAEHLDAYGELIARDLTVLRKYWSARVLRLVVVTICLFLALIFGGTAVMLWAATDSSNWVLWAVPLIPALLAVGILLWPPMDKELNKNSFEFKSVKQQIEADLRLFEEIL